MNVNDFFYGVATGLGLVYLAYFIYCLYKKYLLHKAKSSNQTV